MNKSREGNAAWIACILIATGVCFSASQFKVPATMALLMTDMGLNASQVGWLINMSTVMGIFLAIPSGGIMIKTGPRKVGLFAIAATLCGNLLGVFAHSIMLLMVSRFIEGIGFGLISVVVPPVISAWFVPEKRGFPMSVWSCWIGAGFMLILTASSFIVDMNDASSWRRVWWFCIAFFVIMLILFFLFVRMPESAEHEGQGGTPAERASIKDGLLSVPTWLICILFALTSYGSGAMTSFAPMYLQSALGYNTVEANRYTSIFTIGMIVGGLLMGVIQNHVKDRNRFLIICTAIYAIVSTQIFRYSASIVIPMMILCGLAFSMVPAVVMTVAPDTAPSPHLIGISMGFVVIGMNTGTVLSSLIGKLIDSGGFNSATMSLIVTGAAAVMLAIAFYWAMQKKTQAKAR